MTHRLLLVVGLAACATEASAPPEDESRSEELRTCGSSHAKVGQTTALSQRAHGVRGAARIVDDCTIELTDFHYDGGGIDVRIYGALDGDYENGFAISPSILGDAYAGGTLRVQLPVGMTLDDLDGISVWCVAASFSFGDGLFAP